MVVVIDDVVEVVGSGVKAEVDFGSVRNVIAVVVVETANVNGTVVGTILSVVEAYVGDADVDKACLSIQFVLHRSSSQHRITQDPPVKC